MGERICRSYQKIERLMMWQFVALLGVHWVADFILQTHWQASNKSRRIDALAKHVASYTAALAVASIVLFGIEGAPFAAVNGVLHLGTDAVTSRWTSRLWAKQEWHNFFVVIGLDQLIHQVTLAATMWGTTR
jgi:Protein of unknown function (DUF3307)